jgi:predicted amidohydrolase YtcJ
VELIVDDAMLVTTATGGGRRGSMLVRDGRIAAVGAAGQVRAQASRGAAVARLDGATVVPGLIDAHCHVANVGYLAAGADCSQPSAPDIPAIQVRLREAADRTPEGSWVTGSGYVEYKLRENRHPVRADLDEAVPGRPAVLYHTSLHACVLNTAALAEAGFTDGQPDPPDGAFGRDGQGRLDGVVYEGPMFALFERNLRRDLGRMDAGQRAALVRSAERYFTALGITSVCDADMRRDTLAAFADADSDGRLRQRIYGLVVHEEIDWLNASGVAGRRSDRLAASAVKIWADGGMSSRTAAINGTYPVPPYGSGILFFGRDELTGMVRDFDRQGFQVCIHAQGDRGIGTALDAYAAVLAEGGGTRGNARRHRIEHAGAMYPPMIGRAARLGIVIASQPGFLSVLGDGFAAAFAGHAGQLYPFASWRRAGITVAGSSDAPVITASPLIGIRDAVLRRTAGGRVLGPAERVTPGDALALYTQGGAFAVHREHEIGSLEPGKLADFTVLDGSPLAADAERIGDIQVLATVIGGTTAYQDGVTLLPSA